MKGISLKGIELLKAELLYDVEKLDEIDHWLKVMNRPQGWHYDMDIIWLLNNLLEAGLKKGDTILDAGAGMGVTQFVLAARGFNVISLDFTPRTSPELAEGIFSIEVDEQDKLKYEHNYIGFVKYIQDSPEPLDRSNSHIGDKIWRNLKKGPSNLSRLSKHRKRSKKNLKINEIERGQNHKGFGSIQFLREIINSISSAAPKNSWRPKHFSQTNHSLIVPPTVNGLYFIL